VSHKPKSKQITKEIFFTDSKKNKHKEKTYSVYMVD
jgi:hypothetical protein